MYNLIRGLEDLTTQLEETSYVCTDVLNKHRLQSPPPVDVSPEEEEVARELEALPSPEHVPMWLHCEEMGFDYDSDQSRGC